MIEGEVTTEAVAEEIRTEDAYLHPKPWERQPGEGDMPFTLWSMYRDMEKPSIRGLAASLDKDFTGIGQHSVKWRWRERMRAWLDEKDRIRREAQLDAIRDMAVRQANQSMALQAMLMLPVTAMNARRNDPAYAQSLATLEGLTNAELMNLVIRVVPSWQLAMRAERLARGQSTDNVALAGRLNVELQPVEQDEEKIASIIAILADNNLLPAGTQTAGDSATPGEV